LVVVRTQRSTEPQNGKSQSHTTHERAARGRGSRGGAAPCTRRRGAVAPAWIPAPYPPPSFLVKGEGSKPARSVMRCKYPFTFTHASIEREPKAEI
jgi:hypothetical protein